jgi:DNA invertase Pin-like site-specific DNA recombinase
VGLYARISEDVAGTGLGVQRQEDDGRTVAGLRELEVVETYVDNDVSAFKVSVTRPAFERMLSDLDAGSIDGIVAYDLDRLARQPVDLERLIRVYDSRPGLRFATVQGDVDLQSADGRTMARVMVAFANKSSMDTARRVKRKHLELAQAGVPVGGARPFGWQRDKLTLDPKESRLIREGVDFLLAGGSLHGLVRAWNEAGVLTPHGNAWRTGSLRLTLLSPRLAGFRVHQKEAAIGPDGEPVRGQHNPILDVETWERLVSKMRARPARYRGGRRPKYLLTGVVRCAECSRTMRGNAGRKQYPGRFYYVCDTAGGGCGRVGVSGTQLDELVTELVLAHLGRTVLPDQAPSWPAEPELEAVERQMADLMEAFTARRLPATQVFPAVQRLEDEASALREERAIWAAQAERVAERPADVAGEWPALNVEDRRSVITSVLHTIVVRRARQRGGSFDPARVDVVWR